MRLNNTRKNALLGLTALALATPWASAQGRPSPGPAAPVPGQPPTRPPAAAVPQLPAGTKEGTPVATVNGQIITALDLQQAMRWIAPAPANAPSAMERQRQLEALGLLIDNLLMEQFLKTNGPAVPKTEIDSKLQELANELKKQDKTIESMCKESGITFDQLVANVSTKLSWSAYANPRITDKLLQEYYAGYKDFFDGTIVHVSHLGLKISPTMPPAEKAAVQARVAAIREEIVSGKTTFENAAKKYSQEVNGAQGGVIGFIPRKFAVDEEFSRAAFAMKAGEISPPIASEFSINLIKINERRQGPGSTFAKAKNDAQEMFTEELFQAVLTQQRKTAKLDVLLK